MKKIIAETIAFLLGFNALFTSCSQSDHKFIMTEDRGLAIASLEIDHDSIYMQGNKGKTQASLSVTYSPSLAQDTLIYWSSSDENVATVSDTNLTTCTVTLQGTGKAVITASSYSGSAKAQCVVEGILDETPAFEVADITVTPYANNIELTWTNPSDNAENLYGIRADIYAGDKAEGTPVKSIELEGAGEGAVYSERIRDLTPETEYCISVRSLTVNAILSDEAKEASFTTLAADDEAPAAVTDAVIGSVSAENVVVNWTDSASDDVWYIAVYAYDASDEEIDFVKVLPGNESCTVAGVSDDSDKYTYKIVVVDNNFNVSSEVSLVYHNGAHVSALTATPSTEYSGLLSLAWTDPEEDFDHHSITLSSEGQEDIKVETVAAGVQKYDFTGLVPGALYYVTVSTFDSEGELTGTSGTRAYASKIQIRFYSRESSGFMVVTSAKSFKTQDGNSAAYSYKWLKMPALDGSTEFTYDGDSGKTGTVPTYSIMAQGIDGSASGQYIYLTSNDSSVTGGESSTEAPLTICTADEVDAERVSFATFISAAVSDSSYKALRFAENYYQLGSTSSKVIYRTSAGAAGYTRWHWTITEEVSTPED
ncbi:fibronectin type III domain-containing protein [Treponema sp.]|uniref:fibronectin type III domain-containing protein n=1 Tax=Treponema sp. TaxID=166 RepID=UPI00257FF138|nr:fibronectin type III domain-containing protein [Treponema sp.]MBE6353722.1 hypothetical protein [Treponema sp.]